MEINRRSVAPCTFLFVKPLQSQARRKKNSITLRQITRAFQRVKGSVFICIFSAAFTVAAWMIPSRRLCVDTSLSSFPSADTCRSVSCRFAPAAVELLNNSTLFHATFDPTELGRASCLCLFSRVQTDLGVLCSTAGRENISFAQVERRKACVHLNLERWDFLQRSVFH